MIETKMIMDVCATCPYYTEKAVKAERNRWVGKLFDLKDKMRNQHEAFYEAENYDDAYGLSIAMDMIDDLIKEELQGSR